ncbi:MAG: YggT family protein [Oligoflexia bacterium]|nr:YggT family protein [Oligoflexia bacterium]
MLIFANLLLAIGKVLGMLLQILLYLVIARAIISWVNPDPYNPIVRFLHSSTDPFLRPIRRYVPLVGGGIDLSPILLFVLIIFLQSFLVQTMLDYSLSIRSRSIMVPAPVAAPGSLT